MDNELTTSVPKIYGIEDWGQGYFSVNAAGHLVVHPTRESRGIDVYEQVTALEQVGLTSPLLLRFPQILDAQVQELQQAFANSIREFEYPESYFGVFPMKVNPRKNVVQRLLDAGRPWRLGLEVGTKSELYLGVALEQSPESLLICNGFKDQEFMEMAFWAHKLGKNVVIVVEQLKEVDTYVSLVGKTGTRPRLGLRGRLYARGAGKWEDSGGESSKFGLSTIEMLECYRVVSTAGLEESLCMLHFHIGSQVTDIRKIKAAVREASRVYAKFRRLGAPVTHLNVGGGLGIDYDGSRTSSDSSVNYSIQEFANDVVYTAGDICKNEEVPPPILVSESGRALTVYHSMLVLSSESRFNTQIEARKTFPPSGKTPALIELVDISAEITVKNFREYYHDALERREELFALFDLGYLGLEERAHAELLFQEICEKALHFARLTRHRSEEFQLLAKALRRKYVSNFSVFQSVPDAWAINHLFPVIPIHRLDERPTEFGILADLSCDSDGKLDSFVDVKRLKQQLELHSIRPGEKYLLGVCMLGAYQEVMGSFHNLFGQVSEASLLLNEDGSPEILKQCVGSGVLDVVELVGYTSEWLDQEISARVEAAVGQSLLTADEGETIVAQYRRRGNETTYLK